VLGAKCLRIAIHPRSVVPPEEFVCTASPRGISCLALSLCSRHGQHRGDDLNQVDKNCGPPVQTHLGPSTFPTRFPWQAIPCDRAGSMRVASRCHCSADSLKPHKPGQAARPGTAPWRLGPQKPIPLSLLTKRANSLVDAIANSPENCLPSFPCGFCGSAPQFVGVPNVLRNLGAYRLSRFRYLSGQPRCKVDHWSERSVRFLATHANCRPAFGLWGRPPLCLVSLETFRRKEKGTNRPDTPMSISIQFGCPSRGGKPKHSGPGRSNLPNRRKAVQGLSGPP